MKVEEASVVILETSFKLTSSLPTRNKLVQRLHVAKHVHLKTSTTTSLPVATSDAFKAMYRLMSAPVEWLKLGEAYAKLSWKV